MSAVTSYQAKRESNSRRRNRGWSGLWGRLVAEDSLLSPFRLLLMLAILAALVGAVLVAIAF